MARARDLSDAQLALLIEGGQADDFLVLRYRGTEGLSQLYRFEIELASELSTVTFDTIVGKSAALHVNTANGERVFHGVISRFELTEESADRQYFRAELMPQFWLLTHRYRSRIFQNKTVPAIVTQVLEGAGISSDRFRFNVGEFESRDFTCQYRETEYNFVCRLLEEEGIRWYFEQTADGEVLVMADDSAEYQPIPGEAAVPFRDPSGLNTEVEHVHRMRLGQGVRPGAVVLDDFSFENPKLALESKSDVGRDAALEFVDYPGRYVKQGEGTRYAEIRAQEFETGRISGVGLSNCHRFTPGFKFELTEHSTPVDGEYLVTAVTHQGRQSTERTAAGLLGRGGILDSRIQQALTAAQSHTDRAVADMATGLLQLSSKMRGGDRSARRELTRWLYHAGQIAQDPAAAASATGGNPLEALSIPNLLDDVADAAGLRDDADVYECRFECIPAAVQYRPPRVTPWPVMRGPQTARVVGPKGEEIHTDEFGRVKVKFNWDREGGFDENASCWIRVSHGMAGGQYGMMFLPRVGQEVVVAFLEGNVDQPLIVGRVQNADHMPPYKLPDEKTKSVIKTRSSKGGEGGNEIRFEDLKDKEQILIYAQKDYHQRTKNNRVEAVEADCHLTVGNKRFEKVEKGYHMQVADGDHVVDIGKDLSLAVKGKSSIKIDGTHSLVVGGDIVEDGGGNHKHTVAATYALKAASVKIEASSGIQLVCGGSSIEIASGGIYITGPMVNINSGAGPAVGPVTASATSPAAAEAPAAADTIEFGTDSTYSKDPAELPGEVPPPVGELPEQPATEEEEDESSWIRIRLTDESNNPIPSEKYKIVTPGGEEREGTLDANGEAMERCSPGECQITFPDLDESTWRRKT